ncbi:hypothetical protein CR513_47993, partial [Mucuna pruriens]
TVTDIAGCHQFFDWDLAMMFGCHFPARLQSAAVRHYFTCPLSLSLSLCMEFMHHLCQCLRARPATIQKLLVHSSHLHLLYIDLILPVQTSAHWSLLSQTAIVFQLPCWRLRQSWLKNLQMTLSDSTLNVLILLEFEFINFTFSQSVKMIWAHAKKATKSTGEESKSI